MTLVAFIVERRLAARRQPLLPDVQRWQKPADQTEAVELPRLFPPKAADQQHLAVVFQQLVFLSTLDFLPESGLVGLAAKSESSRKSAKYSLALNY
ncbi:MAG: hypothetical protein U5N55_04365 [Cypionkella sp.]|nr:hypothetical protein [Cypionkella sp.]